MATAITPILNSFRFLAKTGIAPDWTSRFPNAYNMSLRENYIKGVHASKYYRDHLINSEITLQLWDNDVDNVVINVMKYNEATELFEDIGNATVLTIQPFNWVASDVFKITYTPTVEGLYYFDWPGGNVVSDMFYVHSDLELKKRLVKIKYWNETNDFGNVFYSDYSDEGTFATIYQPECYFTGKIFTGEPANDVAGAESDRGDFVKTSASPIMQLDLTLTELHINYAPVVNLIFSCDNLEINGVAMTNKGAVKFKEIKGTDLVNASVQLQENYDYFIN